MDIPTEVIAVVVSFIIGYIIAHYGGEYQVVKNKLQKVTELVTVLNDSLKDDKLTTEEIDSILESIKELCQ